MNKNMKIISMVVGSIVIILILTFTIQKIQKDENIVKVEKELSAMQKTAKEKHPELPATIALHREAQKKTVEKLARAGTDSERMTTAANHFFGFYFNNTRARLKFCQQRGVDITPFVNAFSDLHKKEYAKAQSIYKQIGTDEEKVWIQIRPMVENIVAQDMRDTSSANNMSLEQTCKLLVEKAEAVVSDMHISKSSPAVFQVLSQVQQAKPE